MAGWHHPDRIDGITASRGAVTRDAPASPDEVATVLNRALVHGSLARLPRGARARHVILAILCLEIRRRHAYTEPEMNQCLQAGLQRMNAGVDHVTCRRYLVDLGFLKRDRAGGRYLLNHPRLAEVLSEAAIGAAVALVREELESGNGGTRVPGSRRSGPVSTP